MPGRITPSITRNDDHDAAVRIEPRIENQRLERRVRITGGRRQPRHDRFENFRYAGAGLGAGQQRMIAVEPDDIGDLTPRFLGLRARQIDLVDDRE